MGSRGGHNRYCCDKDFFKHWSDKMAYVLGFLFADGNITDATKIIKRTVREIYDRRSTDYR